MTATFLKNIHRRSGHAGRTDDGSSGSTITTPTGDYNPTTKKYVDEALASSSAGVSIIVRSSQPTGQKIGDFWYQIT